jgi:hypothetical protein
MVVALILTIAKLKPVLPEVVSIMVSPEIKFPASIMYNAILSFEECPGLKLHFVKFPKFSGNFI